MVPHQIFTGEGALTKAGPSICALGKKALIVTDPFMIKFGNVAKVEDMLKSNNAPYAVFSDITGEPTDKMVEAAVEMYKAEGCDYMIALGGGSCIDTMKACAVVAAGGGAITDYMGRSIEEDVAPMVAIPTTAGTGSEATRVTIIADTVNKVKMMLIGPSIVPPVAVVDPQFTMKAYTSRLAQPLTDTFALSAVKRIVANLSTCYHDGKNVEARAQMSIAALEAGIAFTNASVTIIHGMSRPIGALFHVPHGTSNAMLIKVCLPFMITGCYPRFADLGKAIGVAADTDDDKTAAEKFMAKVMSMVDEMGIPTPEQFGINKEEFFANLEKMADDALTSGSPQNTWHQPTKEELIDLYKKLWD